MSQAAADSRRVRRYAILIGIDSYDPDNAGLTGCVHDVEEIAKKLNESVEDVCIYNLTSTWNPNSLQPTEPKENWPTFDNISSCLRQVTQQAQKGEYVYIHYSGHSTVAPPTLHSNSHSGLALVVLEGPTASEHRYFHSAELAEHLRDMVDKGIGVTMVLDCCYSGSTLRGDNAFRYLSYNPQIDEKYPPKISFTQSLPAVVDDPGQSNSLRGSHRASIVANSLARPDGYAILTSSDATQKAFALKFDKLKDSPRHGTLTYFLLETFDMLGGVGGSMQQLCDTITVKIEYHRRSHNEKKQQPVLLGNNRQLFFGCTRPGCSGDIPVMRIIEGTQDRLQLHAGSAHGIVENDKFALRPLGRNIPISLTDTPVTAKAVNIRGITSDLIIVGGEEKAVETGWLATAMTRISLKQFPILLKVLDWQRDGWREAFKQSTSLAVFNQESDVSLSCNSWSFMIVQDSETACEIQDKFKQTVTALTGIEDSGRMKQQLLNQLQHLASFELVRGLTNTSTDADVLQFQSLFSVVLSKKDGEELLEEFSPGCLETKNLFDTCSHPGCMVTVTHSEKLYLRIHNKAGEDGAPLFAYVFAMSCSDWEIDDILTVSRVAIPPKGNSHVPEGNEAKSTFEEEIKFILEGGQDSCEDIVKVFITAQATSFTTLAMPKFGSHDSYAKPMELKAKRGGRAKEDWAAVTFRVHVLRKIGALNRKKTS
jgi:hypothetical protein